MTEIKYSSWPIGIPPKAWMRTELDEVRAKGYEWEDPRDVIGIFEKKVAAYAGAKYAVAVDSCSSAIFLSLKYCQACDVVTIPAQTYVSVPMQIIHAGATVRFEHVEWKGVYQLKPYPIFDGAVRFTKGMYMGDNALHVLSFQMKKRLPIGKGGMILTDDESAYRWLRKASYDGRDLDAYYPDDDFEILGWHMYMTPEDAARGIMLMDRIPELNEDSAGSENHSDLSKKRIFNEK